jgi:hypothetical protein
MTPFSPSEFETVAPAHGTPSFLAASDDIQHNDNGEDADDHQRDHDRIERLTDSWSSRANVRKTLPDLTLDYDLDKPDFLTELLPFHDHPLYQSAPEPYKQAALSCGWLAYNEKTVAIESKIVSPACMHLIDGDVAGFRADRHRAAVSQALVDESYHILLVVQANGVTRWRRKLHELTIPSFELVANMRRHQEKHPERWKKILIQLATAVVSEVLVSDYLRLLADAPGIQRTTATTFRTVLCQYIPNSGGLQ